MIVLLLAAPSQEMEQYLPRGNVSFSLSTIYFYIVSHSFSNFLFFFSLASSLSGVTTLWEMPHVTNKIAVLKDHKERVTDVVFSPVDDCLATASADRTAKLWKPDGTLLQTFEGHLDRLARVAFHPSGKYLGTTSFDKTWRLWDVNTGAELLLQEGHSRSVYGIAFQQEGALAASSGLDSLARVWDLRTGRSILAFQGHIKPVRTKFCSF